MLSHMASYNKTFSLFNLMAIYVYPLFPCMTPMEVMASSKHHMCGFLALTRNLLNWISLGL